LTATASSCCAVLSRRASPGALDRRSVTAIDSGCPEQHAGAALVVALRGKQREASDALQSRLRIERVQGMRAAQQSVRWRPERPRLRPIIPLPSS
jgi:hypothetical protein